MGANRRELLQAAMGAAAGAIVGCAPRRKGASSMESAKSGGRMPVVFVGHGSPMNAIEENRWSRAFRELGVALPQPKAILAISAHWYVGGTFLTENARPETIHDFGGFPQALYEVQYPAAGDAELAKRVVRLIGEARAGLKGDWGLDHGTWSVLRHMRPRAEVPVVQLSIDARMAPAGHVAIGKALGPLRDEGVLVLGSGNVTHNLRLAMRSFQTGDTTTPAWASAFDGEVARAVEQHDGAALAKLVESDEGRMAHPSLDHYLPLLYVVGAAEGSDAVSFPVTGWDGGSLSMRAVRFG